MSAAESAHGNAATYFVDSHIAAGRAGKMAFREVDGAKRSLTYGELSESSSRVAGAFAAAGIQRESRAAMLCLDTIEYPQLFWGALKAGVVAVPVNTLLSASIYDSILRDSRATALFVSAPLYPVVADILADNPYLRTVVVIGGGAPQGSITFETFIKGHEPAQTVAVLPEAEEVDIDIKDQDLRIDVYRSSGAGGQHVNKTDSAVRLTHEPTGLVVQCQSQRSQHQNKDRAIKQLKSKLYELEIQKKEEENQKELTSKTDIGWGHQIRSYVLQPYQLVKDLRNKTGAGFLDCKKSLVIT